MTDNIELQKTDVLIPDKIEFVAKPETKCKNVNYYLYTVALITNVLSFVTGAQITWATPVIPKLSNDGIDNPFGRIISVSEISWMVSMLPFGALIGPLAGGKIADKFGRKKTILVLALLQVVAELIVIFFANLPLYFIARFLAGLGMGNALAILPVYMIEIGEDNNRGALGCSINIFVAFGINFSLIVGPYVNIPSFSVLRLVPLLVFLLGFIVFCPETPTFLAAIHKEEELEKSLVKLRNQSKEAIELEKYKYVQSTVENRKTSTPVRDLFKTKSSKRGLLICLVLIFIQQSCGYGSIVTYMSTIFMAARINWSSHICIMVVGSFQILGTVLSTIIVDKAGRKILLLTSCIGNFLSLSILSIYFYLHDKGIDLNSFQWLPLLSLILFIVTFAVGLGPVPWVVVAEIFPGHLRSVAASLTSFCCFVTIFFMSVSFLHLSEILGMAQCFFLYALVAFGGSIFVYYFVPETKGKSLPDILKLLE